MTIHTITAFFDDRAHADEAVALLRQAGLSDSNVTLSPSDARDEFATFDPLSAGEPKRKGFWGMLEDMFGGSDDHDLYAEGVRRGSTLLTAHVDDDRLDEAVEILDRHGSIDLDEREVSWRNDGWLGFGRDAFRRFDHARYAGPGHYGHALPPIARRACSGRHTGVVRRVVPGRSSGPGVGIGLGRVAPTLSVPPIAAADRGDADVLQVLEERLVIGKRSVSRGKVRVHSYVVENPVTEEVRLRDETIRVDRQAMDRVVSADDLKTAGFHDRTIEMEEVDEEAVVSKTARLVEEVGLRKDVSNRIETIHDTLRSTKVDIDDRRDMAAEDVRAAEVLPGKGPAGSVPIKPV